MKKTFINLLAIAAMLFGAVVAPSTVYAEGEEENSTPAKWIQVSPAAITVTMQGGDVLEGDSRRCTTGSEYGCYIEVKNIGTESFRFRMYVTPHSVTGENNEVSFTDTNSTYTQIARWVTFDDGNGKYADEVYYELKPDEAVKIPFRVTVPEDVPGGMQQAAVWAEVVGGGSTSGTGINTVARAATVIAGRSIGDTRQTAEISDYSFERFSLGGNLTAHATVKNTGNTDFTTHYNYTAKTFFGKVLDERSGEIAAYPGIEYHVDVDWDNTPYLGIFQVEFKVTAANAETAETHIVVIMPIPIMLLLILLLTVVIIWIIIIIRKRKERKSRLLV